MDNPGKNPAQDYHLLTDVMQAVAGFLTVPGRTVGQPVRAGA
jgi:hypothetical protein